MAMNGSDVKKVRFFRDGDANFAGVSVAISKSRYRNFDSLLNDLSRKVPLPFGVRTLHTPGGIHHVYDIDQIQDGRDYVCSTFHARPIKRLDYVGNSSRPSWRVSKRPFGESPKQSKSADSGGKLFHARNMKPKTLTVIAKDDSSNRARLILNRRTAMTYEGVLQTVSDILQLNSGAVKDLFTMEGKKIGGLSDLINGPDIVVATGRSPGSVSARSLPSRLLKRKNHQKNHSLPSSSKKANKRDAMNQPQHSKSFTKASPYTQRQSRGKDKKVKGNPYVFTVKTSDIDDAGTESDVTVVVYGSKGKTGELKLGASDGRKFVPGSKEETEMDVGNIGKIYKMRVMHDADEGDDDAGWHLQEIIMTSVARKNEELIFHCDKWFSNSEEEADSVRELVATKNGKALAEVTTYEISVVTGEVASAGTDSNVFINIYGENGDTGRRWLKKSKDDKELFQPGSIDVFEIEAVSLDKISKIIIGHDNTGDVPGWFLDKVLLKDIEEDVEYVCNCRKWLDEDEDDGKTERILKASALSDSIQSSKELWKSNEWKFQDSNETVLISAANGKTLQINTSDGEVYAASADGDDNNDTAENSKFMVTEGGEDKSRIFSVKSSNGTFNLTLDNGKVTARQGKPGLLSEFFVEIHQGNLISLESVVHKGSYIGLSESDEVVPVANDSNKRNLFNVKVKGILRNLGRIRLRPAFHPASALIESNGHVYGDGESKEEGSEFVVHKVGKGVRAFQSATTDKFIRVNDKEIDCKGEDNYDDECQFIVHKDKTTDNVRLESGKIPGVFLGVEKHGRIKLAVDVGEEMTRLTVEVLSFGSEDVKKSSSKSQASYDYDEAFDDDAANDDKASSRGSVSSGLRDKGCDYDSDDQSKHSRSSSRQSDHRPKSSRSSRHSARSSQSKRGSADSVKDISRPSSSRNEEGSKQASPAPDDSPNDKKEGDAASHLDPNAKDRDTYRTNTPANSVAGNSRPPSLSAHSELQEALSRIDNAETERPRSSSRTSRPSSRSSVKSPAKQTQNEEVTNDAEIIRSNSVASDKDKSNSRSQTPAEAEAEENHDNAEAIKDDSRQKSNVGSRASNSSRPGSSNRVSQSRASSVGARSRKSSASKRDSTYEGLVNNHSRPASRSGSKASGKISRSSSRRSETVGPLEEQGSESAEKNETADGRSSHVEAEMNEEQKPEEDVKKMSTEEVAASEEQQLNNNDEQKRNSENPSEEVADDNSEDKNVTEEKQEEKAEENAEEKKSSNEVVSDKSAEENADNNEEKVSASRDEDDAAKISEGLAEEDIEKEDDKAKSRPTSRQSVVSKDENTEESKSRPTSAEADRAQNSDKAGSEEDTKKPEEAAADENQESENTASGRESKVLSPTPPKTPRSSVTPRRPSSHLSSRSDNSRPGSRSPSRRAAADQNVIVAEGSEAEKGTESEDNDKDVPKEGEGSIVAGGEDAGKADIATGDKDEENKHVAAAEQAIDETELAKADDKNAKSETPERSEVNSENIANEDNINSKDDDVKQEADHEDKTEETSNEGESKDAIEKADSSDSNEGGNDMVNDETAVSGEDDDAGKVNEDNVNEAVTGNEENTGDSSEGVERQEEVQTSEDDSIGKQEEPKQKADDAVSKDEEDDVAKEESNDETDKVSNGEEPVKGGINEEGIIKSEEQSAEEPSRDKDDGQTEAQLSDADKAEDVNEEEVNSNEEQRGEEVVNEDKDDGKTGEHVSDAGGEEDVGKKDEEEVKSNEDQGTEELVKEEKNDDIVNNIEGNVSGEAEKEDVGKKGEEEVKNKETDAEVEKDKNDKETTENTKEDVETNSKDEDSNVANEEDKEKKEEDENEKDTTGNKEDENKQSEAGEDQNMEVKDNNKENQESGDKDKDSAVLKEDKDNSKAEEDENKEVKDNNDENQESSAKDKDAAVLNENKDDSKVEEGQNANSEEQAS